MKPKCFHFQATLTLNEAIYFDSQDPDGYVPVYFDVKILQNANTLKWNYPGTNPTPCPGVVKWMSSHNKQGRQTQRSDVKNSLEFENGRIGN